MAIKDFSAKLSANAKVKAGVQEPKPETVKLATSILVPQLDQLGLDCSNCGGMEFNVIVSPLKEQLRTAAIFRKLRCVQCKSVIEVEDGKIHGRESAPAARMKPHGR